MHSKFNEIQNIPCRKECKNCNGEDTECNDYETYGRAR